MAEHIQQTLAALQDEIRKAEDTLGDKKRLVNMLAKHGGLPLPYPDADRASADSLGSIGCDKFYGRPLAAVMREYLLLRKNAGLGAATVNEIFDSLTKGGFKFDTKNEDNAKRGLRISLSKNTAVFHRLPNGTFGLAEWYPAIKAPRTTVTVETDTDDEGGAS